MLVTLALAAQLVAAAPVDTPPPRPRVRAVEISEGYGRRLTLHRRLSYATIPLFAMQWAAGNEIWHKGALAPDWVWTTHRVGAASIATVFTVNTVTGVWNLWDSRSVKQGRTLRYVHAISMIAADAGFTWAGAKLSQEAERSFEKKRLHRKVALSSVGIAVTSGLMMKFLNK